MATEKRLIDANAFKMFLENVRQDYLEEDTFSSDFAALVIETVQDEYLAIAPTIDAVEVEDKELLKAIKMLIKQYDHSKQSDYVHSPVAHALFHTWKKVDGDGNA